MDGTVERVRAVIRNAHVFKLPPRPSAAGWRGADWTEEVWQGLVKVVERGDKCAIVLCSEDGVTFAVCPYKDGAVDRCIDSSRYFVLRIENSQGRHMFIGLAFNERNDAFDFNTSLEDSRREKEKEKDAQLSFGGFDQPQKDYSLKEGEKIRVAVPRVLTSKDKEGGTGTMSAAAKRRAKRAEGGAGVARPLRQGGLLAPSSRDTPGRRAMMGGGGGGGGGSANVTNVNVTNAGDSLLEAFAPQPQPQQPETEVAPSASSLSNPFDTEIVETVAAPPSAAAAAAATTSSSMEDPFGVSDANPFGGAVASPVAAQQQQQQQLVQHNASQLPAQPPPADPFSPQNNAGIGQMTAAAATAATDPFSAAAAPATVATSSDPFAGRQVDSFGSAGGVAPSHANVSDVGGAMMRQPLPPPVMGGMKQMPSSLPHPVMGGMGAASMGPMGGVMGGATSGDPFSSNNMRQPPGPPPPAAAAAMGGMMMQSGAMPPSSGQGNDFGVSSQNIQFQGKSNQDDMFGSLGGF